MVKIVVAIFGTVCLSLNLLFSFKKLLQIKPKALLVTIFVSFPFAFCQK